MKLNNSPLEATSPLVTDTIAKVISSANGAKRGTRLSTEQALKEHCHVSRTTIRKALDAMHRQGWILKQDRLWVWAQRPASMPKCAPKLEHQGREEQARAYLVELLASGKIGPGTTVTELGIAKTLGMSTVPVREAMRSLESLGLLVRRARRSWQTAKLTESQVRELMEVRRLVELHCIDQLQKHQESKYLRALKKIHARTNILIDSVPFDLQSSLKIDRAFHETLLRSSENSFLIEHNRFIYMLIEYEFSHSAMPPEQLREGLRDHLKVLNSILTGDWKTARRELIRHLRDAEEILLKMTSPS